MKRSIRKDKKELKYSFNELSGVYGYDQQFLSVNGENGVRLTLLDVNTNIILDQWIAQEYRVKMVEKFLKTNLKDKKLETIVTDGKNGYNIVYR